MSQPSGWRIEYERRAVKDLRRLDAPIRRRVVDAINVLTGESPVGDLRPLVGRPGARLRVGDWRVLVDRDDAARVIVVERVLPRGRAYDR